MHDVLSRLIYDARAAKSVEAFNYNGTVTFAYRTINESTKGVIAVKSAERVYLLYGKLGAENSKVNYKRVEEFLSSPITGDNYFGRTRVTQFFFSKPADNVLRVTLEMQSEVSGHKIKISTAVCMPGCESFEVH